MLGYNAKYAVILGGCEIFAGISCFILNVVAFSVWKLILGEGIWCGIMVSHPRKISYIRPNFKIILNEVNDRGIIHEKRGYSIEKHLS